MSLNHNKHNLQREQRVILDEGYANSSEVTIKDFTPNKMFATVKADDGNEWQVMTNRLTPLKKETQLNREEGIKICVTAFEETHKQERYLGTICFIVTLAFVIILFPITIPTGIFILIMVGIYIKFLYDIKEKWNNAIQSFKDKAEKV